MKFAIQINEGPYQHQASDSAYFFTKNVLEKGHEVFRVLFYHDGVNNATRLTTPPQDDRHVVNRWADLAEKYDLDMVVCVAAAQRRVSWTTARPSVIGRTPPTFIPGSASPGSGNWSRRLSSRIVSSSLVTNRGKRHVRSREEIHVPQPQAPDGTIYAWESLEVVLIGAAFDQEVSCPRR